MIEPSPSLLIAAASAFVGLAIDDEQGGPPDDGAAFLHRWGYWAHFDHSSGISSWPLIETRTAEELAAVAMARYVLRDAPQIGDIFLQHSSPERRFVRAGVIVGLCGSGRYNPRASYYDATTIEADSDRAGQFRGRHILRMSRRFLPDRGDRFIRWAELNDHADVPTARDGASSQFEIGGELEEAA